MKCLKVKEKIDIEEPRREEPQRTIEPQPGPSTAAD